ncbi:hypothetical protein PROFUN_12029 [Planoprotostelium fungivorum]|uniref:Uncharacterized protein n=1 Tax=Planoprotostelium fungivorum TaxID=1890364 RepID=A0A2P6MRF6_9EUKA|nr:hypothetical protein PROFUN_12029 [Planoprotostelium fungivorum]
MLGQVQLLARSPEYEVWEFAWETTYLSLNVQSDSFERVQAMVEAFCEDHEEDGSYSYLLWNKQWIPIIPSVNGQIFF